MTQTVKFFLFMMALACTPAYAGSFDLPTSSDAVNLESTDLGNVNTDGQTYFADDADAAFPGRPGHGGPGHGGPGHGRPGHGHPGHGGPHHPGFPGRPGHPGFPGYPRMSECFSRDRLGMTFVARGWRSFGELQREAFYACRYHSRAPRSCRVIGCR